jgi:hypothetical protein
MKLLILFFLKLFFCIDCIVCSHRPTPLNANAIFTYYLLQEYHHGLKYYSPCTAMRLANELGDLARLHEEVFYDEDARDQICQKHLDKLQEWAVFVRRKKLWDKIYQSKVYLA